MRPLVLALLAIVKTAEKAYLNENHLHFIGGGERYGKTPSAVGFRCEEHIFNRIMAAIIDEPELDRIALPLSAASLSFPDLEIRLKEQTVSCRGQLVTLTHHEFAVLAYLARHPGWVFSASQIYEAVWDRDGECCGTAVASVISQIRRKLTPDTPKGGYIRTVLAVDINLNP